MDTHFEQGVSALTPIVRLFFAGVGIASDGSVLVNASRFLLGGFNSKCWFIWKIELGTDVHLTMPNVTQHCCVLSFVCFASFSQYLFIINLKFLLVLI